MAEFTRTYRCVAIRQTPSSPLLLLFGAPAREIEEWAGVPQKKLLGQNESIGFNRDLNEQRLSGIEEFYGDLKNTIQNPLLISSRAVSEGKTVFVPDSAAPPGQLVTPGQVTISRPDFDGTPLLDLLKKLQQDLEQRVPALKGRALPTERIYALKQQANLTSEDPEEVSGEESASENDTIEPTSDPASVVFSDESHILDFWEEVAARVAVLGDGGTSLQASNEFAGFTREVAISFLLPMVVVDGQHRLKAAVSVAKKDTQQPPFSISIEAELKNGVDPAEAQRRAEISASRTLPISLLLAEDPAEHVFQFVVVNQKATPIGRALLGTIVSTTLSNEELSRVSTRLKAAGIPLGESRSVTFLARHESSPFRGLVERGLASDQKDLLQWGVLEGLVRIFQDLQGGRLFHETNDYARIWRKHHLAESAIVKGSSTKGFESDFAYWQSSDGPWRDVFVAFFSGVRSFFSSTTDAGAGHYWGSPRSSNLFNKVSLTILASDFFQFLREKGRPIKSAAEVTALVTEWLGDVDPNYFNRDWKLAGVKKDSPGIRARWAKTWAEYRKDAEKLPQIKSYREALPVDK